MKPWQRINQSTKSIRLLLQAHQEIERANQKGTLKVTRSLDRELNAIFSILEEVDRDAEWAKCEYIDTRKNSLCKERCSDKRCSGYGKHLVYCEESDSYVCPTALKSEDDEEEEGIPFKYDLTKRKEVQREKESKRADGA